ncbi:hypothetical protein HanXRQr2_Chr07g0313641 [Helianthus annuus]|uniref:Uncharacterized protein n=1 Tax=Helianthus annuus TaxID=4232 RepID=A0A9K3IPS3_HELAN|nr:hypothetical protein HanXRQr2_Chr07g0313641 [Helianthus annuus]
MIQNHDTKKISFTLNNHTSSAIKYLTFFTYVTSCLFYRIYSNASSKFQKGKN